MKAIAWCIGIAMLAARLSAASLTADQIALVVNRNEPQSAQLATFYAQARGVPADRIISLDLPLTINMTFDRYERSVTPVVREFLRSRGLEQQIHCLVTFYGVPLRIDDRVNSIIDERELARLRDLDNRITNRLLDLVKQMEARAKVEDPAFTIEPADQSFQSMVLRTGHAAKTMSTVLANTTDPAARQKLQAYLNEMGAKLTGPVDLDIPRVGATSIPATAMSTLQDRPFDPDSRAAAREQSRQSAGIFNYSLLIKSQIEYFTTKDTGAAVDNELAMVLAPLYPRGQWQPNPLNVRNRANRNPPTLMVMRLDAPSPQIVRDIIANSLITEREGLHGKLVVDARGKNPTDDKGNPDPMGIFDQQLRALADVIKRFTQVPVYLDNNPDVIPPGTVDDVALYCGWYSLAHYVPGMKFNRGAVGYHVASFELLTLHGEHETGWVHGLLTDGVVGTVGPVAEPYLHSFPPPVEFFTLLMTGKLTLAEVYWATNPLVSWMQSCIGDPLYNPYAKNPMLKVEDMPAAYRALVE